MAKIATRGKKTRPEAEWERLRVLGSWKVISELCSQSAFPSPRLAHTEKIDRMHFLSLFSYPSYH